MALKNLIILLILIFICAVMSGLRDSAVDPKKETFTQDFTEYFDYFSSFFMNQNNSSSVTKTNLFNISNIFMDIYCTEANTDCNFSKYRLTNMAIKDPFLAKDCFAINGIIDGIEENSNIRILNNFYNLHKMCCPINIIEVTTSGVTNNFRIKIDNSVQVKYMLLTRPVFIELERFGLFKINYGEDTVNSKDNFAFLNISYDREVDRRINILDTSVSNTSITAVSYHLTHNPYNNVGYQSTSIADPDQLNNLCLFFNKDQINNYSLQLNIGNTSSNRVTSVSLIKNNNNLQLRLTVNNSNINDLIVDLNDFRFLITDTTALNSNLIIVMSVDKVVILGIQRNSQNETFYMMKTKHFIVSDTRFYLQYLKTSVANISNSICPPKALPNLAHVALRLGYSF